MSGGTLRRARDRGAISEDGTTATSKAGAGHFRVVCETVARGVGGWEGALQRVRGSEAISLFVCIGPPDADTEVESSNVLSKRVNGSSYACVRGTEVDDDGVALALPVGGILSWRVDCAVGTVHARVGDGAWALLWKDITPAEVAAGLHVGVFLNYDARVTLVSFGLMDIGPVLAQYRKQDAGVRSCMRARVPLSACVLRCAGRGVRVFLPAV
jgi:hypothetical protein